MDWAVSERSGIQIQTSLNKPLVLSSGDGMGIENEVSCPGPSESLICAGLHISRAPIVSALPGPKMAPFLPRDLVPVPPTTAQHQSDCPDTERWDTHLLSNVNWLQSLHGQLLYRASFGLWSGLDY